MRSVCQCYVTSSRSLFHYLFSCTAFFSKTNTLSNGNAVETENQKEPGSDRETRVQSNRFHECEMFTTHSFAFLVHTFFYQTSYVV